MANCMILEKYDVSSSVSQGTVLASLSFIIMIADIDQNLENSISRLFASGTKVSTKNKITGGYRTSTTIPK